MIKKYNDFILENLSTHFDNEYNEFIDIYKNQIVPKIGEVKVFTNFMLDGVLEKSQETRFHTLRRNLMDARSEFSDTIQTLSIRFFKKSFSSLASNIDYKPDEDFEEMQKIIDKTGFTLDVIKKLFNKKVCQLTSEYFPYFIHQNRLDIINGYIDVYLYMINEKLEISKMTGVEHQIDLGGQGFDKSMDSQEWIIKYAYGYHKTPYGQLFIKQLGLTPDQFVEYTFMNIKEYFDDQMRSNFAYETQFRSKGDFDDFDWSKFIQVDDDGFIVYYNEMENDIIENHGDFGGIITEEFLKKLIMDCFREIKDVIKIQDSGDYFHFHE